MQNPHPERRLVAAFDYDGTITRGDTMFPFLQRLCGTRRVVTAVTALSGSMVSAATGRIDREEPKAALLAKLLAGRQVEEVEEAAGRFADRVVARQLRPETIERTQWHRDQGHHIVVVSASPEVFIGPVARHLGFEAVLGTRLEIDGGRLTGRLVGPNNRGPEKARRLREHLGAGQTYIWAYGDSAGDREMLAMADEALRVTRRGLVAD